MEQEQTGKLEVKEQADHLGDASSELIASHQALLQATIRRDKKQIEVLSTQAGLSWRQFIIRLIERHTEMAASAALALTRRLVAAIERHDGVLERHTKEIEQLKQRTDALENHHHQRG